MRTLTACAVIAALLGSSPAPVAAEEGDPPTGKLIGAGFAFAIPTYWIGVVAHEGSHALAGLAVGADVKQFSVLPGRYGARRDFYFGYVLVTGLRSTRQRSFFWLAPKLTDLVLLGGYAGLSLSGNLPENRYGALALTVLATGFAIDFGKDIISMRRANDVVKTYNANGLESEVSRIPFRLLQLALTAGAGYAIYRGYRHSFEHRDPELTALIPLFSGSL